jgi:hypothetical protein
MYLPITREMIKKNIETEFVIQYYKFDNKYYLSCENTLISSVDFFDKIEEFITDGTLKEYKSPFNCTRIFKNVNGYRPVYQKEYLKFIQNYFHIEFKGKLKDITLVMDTPCIYENEELKNITIFKSKKNNYFTEMNSRAGLPIAGMLIEKNSDLTK